MQVKSRMVFFDIFLWLAAATGLMHADRSFAATEELDREATARARAAAW
jgi:uncharacterized protein YcbX